MKKIIFLLSLMTISLSNAQDLTVASGALLTIANEGGVYVTGDFENSGTTNFTSKSDAFGALIIRGNITAGNDFTYNRYVNIVGSGEWDLIGSPLENASINTFVTDNAAAIATANDGTDTHYALGTYDHVNDIWTNYTSATVASAGNFDLGMGYQMATLSGATLAFNGSMSLTDVTQSIINERGDPVTSPRGRWNLIANPYPSYLNANLNADPVNNFLKVNLDSGVIDATYSAIYGWKADGTGYELYNYTSDATYIAPGQAFWVAAASSTAADVSFTEAMQTLNGGDDFVLARGNNTSTEFFLKLYEGQNFIADSRFYFKNGLSQGLDPGYDAGAFNQSMALMSRLPQDDQGVGMRINAMASSALNTETTIPLVINQIANTVFEIRFEDASIPESTEIYLEDRQTQTLTDLRRENFRLTPASDLTGMGRFYLRLGNVTLGENDSATSSISIYKSLENDFITIEGLASVKNANMQLYNVIGQEVLNMTLAANMSKHSVSTYGLEKGVYILKLQANQKTITKKIIIN
tara:strand:+ start:128 stop:1702 length:1575 start_codon:yes stop_codon:yes gene_type:complete